MKKLSSLILFVSFLTSMSANADYYQYLQAFWDFETIQNNKLVDLSGKGNDGTFVGKPSIIEGIEGQCMQFYGNEFITLANDHFMDGECDLTMTCWFKIETDPLERRQLFCISGGESFYDPMTFQFWNGKPYDFAFEDCIEGKYAIRSNQGHFNYTLERDQWYFLTVVLCEDMGISTMKIYLDCNLIETVANLSDMQSYAQYNPGKLCPRFHQPMVTTIGALNNADYWNWIGCIDDMKFFKTCMNQDEIVQEYDRTCLNNYYLRSNLTLNCSANTFNNGFILTDKAKNSVGSAWLKDKLNISGGFSSEFVFNIDGTNGLPTGEGFAFVIQNKSDTVIGTNSAGLGYSGMKNTFAIEFDIDSNSTTNDPNASHIAALASKAVITSTHNSPNQIACKKIPITISKNGDKNYFVKIDYDKRGAYLNVYLSQDAIFKNADLVLSIPNFKLEDYIELPSGMAYLGFTGATGLSTEKHEILKWEVCPKDTIQEVVLLDCDTAYFNYPNFTNIDGLKIAERAYPRDSKIRVAPAGNYNKGAIWRDREVPVKNGFETNWTFSVSSPLLGKFPDKSEAGADGFAFVIHNSKNQLNAIGASGGGIGYAGIDNCLAIELDLFSNDEFQLQTQYDPNGNHIAVMKCSPTTTINALHTAETQVAVSTDIPTIKSNGTLYYAKIKYDGAAKDLKIWITDAPVFNEPNIHLTDFDLSKYVSLINGAKAYVGITSATGDASQNHDIFNWQFCPTVYDAPMNGVEDEMSSPLVTPNPATDRITINLPEDCRNHDKTLIEIYDMLGKLVYSQNVLGGQSSNDVVINTEGFTPGVYIVNINSGLVNLSEKFVVEKK